MRGLDDVLTKQALVIHPHVGRMQRREKLNIVSEHIVWYACLACAEVVGVLVCM